MSQYSQKIPDANGVALWLVLGSSLAIGCLACSADSLWIDEAWTALIAMEKDLPGWWRRMQESSGSTLQMPLYTLYLWLWEKMAGPSEWALRAGNIPFFVLGQWALFRGLRSDKRLALWTVGIAAASPFLWTYIAEARPYAMQYGAACLVIGGLMQLAKGNPFVTNDCIFFCAGLVIACGSSSLAFPWAGVALILAALLIWKNRTLLKLSFVRLLVLGATCLCLLVLFLYDLWAAGQGGKASAVAPTTGQSLLFVAYELLGFIGLGPARLSIRESQSLSVLAPYSIPLGALAFTLAAALFHLRRIERTVWQMILFCTIVPLLLITIFAVAAPFRLLGRHVTPLLPALLVLLAYAAATPSRWWTNRLFLVLWVASASAWRVDPKHRRDDYRDAAAFGRESLAHSQRVWWAADAAGAEYYKLPLTNNAGTLTAALFVPNLRSLKTVNRPDLVILSKTDVFDPSRDLERFLGANGYNLIRTMPAFTIWESKAQPNR